MTSNIKPQIGTGVRQLSPPSRESLLSSDRAVGTPDDDRFGMMRDFVPRVARVCVEWPSADGVVVGLFGRWGLGKTTVFNLLRRHAADVYKGRRIRIVSFNPWFYEDVSALIASFFATIAEELGRDQTEASARVVKALKAMGSFLTVAAKGVSLWGMKFDPGVISEGFEQGSKILQSTGDVAGGLSELTGFMNSGEKTLQDSKDAVAKWLVDSVGDQGRLVILMDDVDRLGKSDLLSLFRLIRIVSDLPHVTLVVAMDDERVREVLSMAVSEGYGKGYLDKIIQAPIHMPLIERGALVSELSSQLGRTFQRLGYEPPGWLVPNRYFIPDELEVLLGMIQTPRDLARYLNGVRMLLLAGDNTDVHPTDASLIEALRIFHPDVYDRVRRHKGFLTARPRDYDSGVHDRDKTERVAKRTAEFDRIIGKGSAALDLADEQLIRKLLRCLFGDLVSADASRATSSDAAERRVRSPEFFENYFRYESPVGGVSRVEVDAIFQQVLECVDGTRVEALPEVLAVALANRSQDAVGRIVDDIGTRLNGLPLDVLERIGNGLVTSSGAALSEDVSIRMIMLLLRVYSDARNTLSGKWSDELAVAASRALALAAISSRLSVVRLSVLVDKRVRWATDEQLREPLVKWLLRLAAEIDEGDLFNGSEIEEVSYAVALGIRSAEELGEESPISPDGIRDRLIACVNRVPERLPRVLCVATGQRVDSSEFVMTRHAKGELEFLFGDYSRLRDAYRALIERQFEAGASAGILREFGLLLEGTTS